MPETTQDEKSQSDHNLLKAHEGLDWNKLADVFAAQGNMVEAERYRKLAKKQPELQARAEEKRKAAEEKRQLELQDQERRIQKERAKPKPFHDLRFDAVKLKREDIEKMLQVKSNR